jgi:hypothetical protein
MKPGFGPLEPLQSKTQKWWRYWHGGWLLFWAILLFLVAFGSGFGAGWGGKAANHECNGMALTATKEGHTGDTCLLLSSDGVVAVGDSAQCPHACDVAFHNNHKAAGKHVESRRRLSGDGGKPASNCCDAAVFIR